MAHMRTVFKIRRACGLLALGIVAPGHAWSGEFQDADVFPLLTDIAFSDEAVGLAGKVANLPGPIVFVRLSRERESAVTVTAEGFRSEFVRSARDPLATSFGRQFRVEGHGCFGDPEEEREYGFRLLEGHEELSLPGSCLMATAVEEVGSALWVGLAGPLNHGGFRGSTLLRRFEEPVRDGRRSFEEAIRAIRWDFSTRSVWVSTRSALHQIAMDGAMLKTYFPYYSLELHEGVLGVRYATERRETDALVHRRIN